MKRVFWFSLVVAIGVVAVVFATMPAVAKSPAGFAGSWRGDDPDGSDLRWRIMTEPGSEGIVFHLIGSDNVCSACGGEPANLRGVGVEHDPNVLSLSFVGWGLKASDFVAGPISDTFTYNPATDTFTDEFGIEYRRAGSQD
jgi:hypothetical protein